MSAISIVTDKIAVLKPAPQAAGNLIASGYLGSKQVTSKFAAEIAWRSFMSVAAALIPDDLYDWQDPEFDRDPSDDYSI